MKGIQEVSGSTQDPLLGRLDLNIESQELVRGRQELLMDGQETPPNMAIQSRIIYRSGTSHRGGRDQVHESGASDHEGIQSETLQILMVAGSHMEIGA